MEAGLPETAETVWFMGASVVAMTHALASERWEETSRLVDVRRPSLPGRAMRISK
ncbi:hypothetical protein GCM10028812_01950 [Ancylobacter sonchi]